MASTLPSLIKAFPFIASLVACPAMAAPLGAQLPVVPAEVAGQVVDLSGAAVPDALVQALSKGRVVAEARASASGFFTLEAPPGPVEIVARAPELAAASLPVTLSAGQRLSGLQLVLGAGMFAETVTVAANAPPDPGDAAASTTVVTRETLNLVPGRALDDVLVMTPGFSLFRRSSSRVANPTSQGASLRGLAASGASRALVLSDGAPANDPFGGWVYWNRWPRAAINRVEVARGGWSDRYGADAIGGVIQVLTPAVGDAPGGRLLLEGGSRATGRVSGFAGAGAGGWSAFGAAEGARSGRAPVVAEEARGAVDVAAWSKHASGIGAATWTAGPAFTGTFRVNPFWEERSNGTPEQWNDTRSTQASVSLSGSAGANAWSVQAWGQLTRYRQTFTAVSEDRLSETLVNSQRVNSDAAGARAQWYRAVGPAAVAAGLEASQVHAQNVERRPQAGTSSSGGRQRGPALFARIGLPLGSRVVLEGGGRWETWVNRASHGDQAERRASSFSPRVALVWRPAGSLIAHASTYRAFRAPTLNELYRGFRVGDISTRPNDQLRPEQLTGVEAGVSYTRHRLSLRAAGWWSSVERPVVNVTVAPLLRQRQNVGEIAARGMEAEAVLRPFPALEWTAALSLTRSTLRDPDRPSVDGRRVPQVPGRQLSSRLRLLGARLWASVEIRHVGRQYEDDRNELWLRPASLVDFAACWSLNRRADLLLGIENVMDREVEVGRTPVPTVGLPRTVHVALRVRTGGKP